MNRPQQAMSLSSLLPLLMLGVALSLAACAPGRQFARSGQELIQQGHIEEGLADLEKASRAEPDNREYRLGVIRQREIQTNELLKKADAARDAGRWDEASVFYRRVREIAPTNLRAREGLLAVENAGKHGQILLEADALFKAGKHDEAASRLRNILAENPNHVAALALKRRVEDAATTQAAVTGLRSDLSRPVTFEFRDANLKAVFEALSRSTGVNFVFDREVKPDIKITLFITNTSVDDVIKTLTVTNQLDRKYLNDNTVLIYPNTPTKQKDYQELTVRTFYLVNAEAKLISTMLRTVLKTKDMYADDKLNSITIRDTPEAIRLAEKLIAAQDLAEPEVVLEVEVLEVKRSRLSDLGVNPPSQFTVLNIVPNPSTVVSTATGATTVVDNTLTTTQLTVDKLRHLNGKAIGIDNPSVNLRSELGDTNLLANPRIRVKNREKARILIGDRVPVISTTSTANVGVSESVNYLDVGLKLDVEPSVYLDDEVGIKVGLEVSNIVKEIKSKTGSLTYQLGTRLATTSLRLKDGESQALAGLISDEDRQSSSGIPGLIDLPLVNRLFSSAHSDHSKTEIVLLITPHIVRNLSNPRSTQLEYSSGTEAAAGVAPLRLHGSAKVNVPPSGQGGAPIGRVGRMPPLALDAEPAEAPASIPSAAPAAERPVAPLTVPEPEVRGGSQPRPIELVIPQQPTPAR
jgi:general secretion pathway protein D